MKIHYTDSLTCTPDVLYQLARENCLSLRKIHVIREVTGVLQRSGVRVYMHSAASKAPTSLRKRPGFSRSVSFCFSFSSATFFSFFFRPTAPRVASLRQELSDFLGYEYAAGGGMQEAGGDGISNAVNEKKRRGSTSKKRMCAVRRSRATQSRHARQTRQQCSINYYIVVKLDINIIISWHIVAYWNFNVGENILINCNN